MESQPIPQTQHDLGPTLNTLVGATSSILGEALALGATGGLSDGQMMEVIAESAVASPLIKYKCDMIASAISARPSRSCK